MKNVSKGKTSTLKEVIPIKENQTISKKLSDLCNCHILLTSPGQNTDISPELYAEERIHLILKGEISVDNEKLIDSELMPFEENRIFDIGVRKKR